MGFWVWGLGYWGLGIGPNPQSPIKILNNQYILNKKKK